MIEISRRAFIKLAACAATGQMLDPTIVRLLGQAGIEKVTDPKKKVTDPVILNMLQKKGINKDYVEFSDYSKNSIRAKTYKDKITGKEFKQFDILPMVRPDDGTKINPRFYQGIEKWMIGNNLFEGEIDNKGVISVTPVLDQVEGITKNSLCRWNPQLFLDKTEIKPVSVRLLEIDPVNQVFENTTLEFDYTICKRHLRLIQGKLLERWIFTENPRATVRIVHNYSGPLALFKLGQFAINEDIEEIPESYFTTTIYPLEVDATLTVYTDDSGSNAFDGALMKNQSTTFANNWSGDANYKYASDAVRTTASYGSVQTQMGASTNYFITRSMFSFDTSDIPDTDLISSAIFSFGIHSKLKGASFPDNGIGVTKASAGAYTELDLTHYKSMYNSRELISDLITHSSISTASYADWTFTEAGLEFINVSGYTSLGLMNYYDFTGDNPGYGIDSYGIGGYYSENATLKPKLTVEHYPSNTGKKLFGGISGQPFGGKFGNISKVFGH